MNFRVMFTGNSIEERSNNSQVMMTLYFKF